MVQFRPAFTLLLITFHWLSSFSFQTKRSSISSNICSQNNFYNPKLSRKAYIGSSLVTSSDYDGRYLKNTKKDDIDLSKFDSVRIPEFGTSSTADVILNTATAIGGALGGLVLGGVFEGYATELVGATIAAWLPTIGLIALGILTPLVHASLLFF
jgi:hypothetical protein